MKAKRIGLMIIVTRGTKTCHDKMNVTLKQSGFNKVSKPSLSLGSIRKTIFPDEFLTLKSPA